MATEEFNKYHISKEGKIYRVNEDGSFTSLGDVEDKLSINSMTKKSYKSFIIIAFLFLIVIGLTLFYFILQENATNNRISIENLNEIDESCEDNQTSFQSSTGGNHSFSDVNAQIIDSGVIVSFSYYIKGSRDDSYSVGVNGLIKGIYSFEYDGDINNSDIYIEPTNAIDNMTESEIPDIIINLYPQYRNSNYDFGGGTIRVEIPFKDLTNTKYELEYIDYWIHLYKNDVFIYRKDFKTNIN